MVEDLLYSSWITTFLGSPLHPNSIIIKTFISIESKLFEAHEHSLYILSLILPYSKSKLYYKTTQLSYHEFYHILH